MKAATTLSELKRIDWSRADASLWALYFEGKGENAPIKVRLIRTTPRLQQRLRVILVGQAKQARSVKPYAWETSDLEDDETLFISSEHDLLKDVVAAIDASRKERVTGNGAAVGSMEEMLSAIGYIIRLDCPKGNIVHGFKKMPESAGTRRKLFEVVFDQLELDEELKVERFRLSKMVDGFHFDGISFVVSKKDFEAGLRYREAMRASAKAAMSAIDDAKILANATDLLKDGEDRYHLLRRLAGIGKDSRFTDPNWLKKVRELNARHKWGLKFTDAGLLLLDEESLNLILTLLRDRRALTMIFGEMIDADVVRVVAAASAS